MKEKKLFIGYKKGMTKEIHMNTILGWLKKVIVRAYEKGADEDKQVSGVKAHQVRAVAASWALHCKGSMDDIMAACTWKSPTTFTSFYLKDMTLFRDNLCHLGPFVAAGISC